MKDFRVLAIYVAGATIAPFLAGAMFVLVIYWADERAPNRYVLKAAEWTCSKNILAPSSINISGKTVHTRRTVCVEFRRNEQ